MKKTPAKKIVVKVCNSWSSSSSRTMSAIGRAASAAAIRQAEEAKIQVSYLKDGMVVKSAPETETSND